jgi:hypothetical protein
LGRTPRCGDNCAGVAGGGAGDTQCDSEDGRGRVDTVFKVGDQVLLRTKELLDAADIGKLRPRWDGPFSLIACPGPNANTLELPSRMLCSPTVNVDRFKPFFERNGVDLAPWPVSDVGRKAASTRWSCCSIGRRSGVTHGYLVRWSGHHDTHGYLVRWSGHHDTSTDDEWLREEELGHCPAKVAEYDDAAAPRRRSAPRGVSDTAAVTVEFPSCSPPFGPHQQSAACIYMTNMHNIHLALFCTLILGLHIILHIDFGVYIYM